MFQLLLLVLMTAGGRAGLPPPGVTVPGLVTTGPVVVPGLVTTGPVVVPGLVTTGPVGVSMTGGTYGGVVVFPQICCTGTVFDKITPEFVNAVLIAHVTCDGQAVAPIEVVIYPVSRHFRSTHFGLINPLVLAGDIRQVQNGSVGFAAQ